MCFHISPVNLENSTNPSGEFSGTEGDDRWRQESLVIGVYLENLAVYADKISTPKVTTDDDRNRSS